MKCRHSEIFNEGNARLVRYVVGYSAKKTVEGKMHWVCGWAERSSLMPVRMPEEMRGRLSFFSKRTLSD